MDLLYSRYSNPFEFMNVYINQGRFGEFVENIIAMDQQRKKEAAEKDNEDKLFNMYVHSMSDKSFIDWKNEVFRKSNQEKTVIDNTEETVVKIVNDSTNILKGFSLKG